MLRKSTSVPCIVCDENKGLSYNAQLINFTNKLNDIIMTNSSDTFLIMGDFNFSDGVTWSRSKDDFHYQATNIRTDSICYFIDTISSCGLNQYNGEINKNGRILDLVLANKPLSVQACSEPLVPEDGHHRSLHALADFAQIDMLTDQPRFSYKFKKGDYASISSELDQSDWDSILSEGSIDHVVKVFYDRLNELRVY